MEDAAPQVASPPEQPGREVGIMLSECGMFFFVLPESGAERRAVQLSRLEERCLLRDVGSACGPSSESFRVHDF